MCKAMRKNKIQNFSAVKKRWIHSKKKFIFYGLALIPPAFTGFYRYKGMKHFPTDVITGIAVGAATGILVPHLHKRRDHKNLTLIPVTGRYMGLAMSLKF